MPIYHSSSEDFDKIYLTYKERLLLLNIKIRGKVVADIYSQPYRQLHKYDFIKRNYVYDVEHREDIFDGTVSLTMTYKRYCLYRREQFFRGKLPVIISILALMKSYGVGIDDIIAWCTQQLML